MRHRSAWLAALALLWGVGAWGAAGPTEPPAESWLSINQARREKPPVLFSHQRHPKSRMACEQCHHDYKGKRNLWREGQPVEKCQACHRQLPQRGVRAAEDAFHRQCKGCHLSRRKLRQPAGPIKCEGCHRLQKQGGG
jgi:hypothetical protein